MNVRVNRLMPSRRSADAKNTMAATHTLKVERLRHEVEDGDYNIDIDAVANALMRLPLELVLVSDERIGKVVDHQVTTVGASANGSDPADRNACGSQGRRRLSLR